MPPKAVLCEMYAKNVGHERFVPFAVASDMERDLRELASIFLQGVETRRTPEKHDVAVALAEKWKP